MVSHDEGPLPTGPEQLCLDAMVLIAYNNAGYLEFLGNLVGRAYTADVITRREIFGGIGRYPQNQAILDADWLVEAPVRDEDAIVVSTIHGAWGSGDHEDMGEAEIIALCSRHGWTAITDDAQGRGTLEAYEVRYGYRCSLLLAAAACGEQELDGPAAWEIHREVEQGSHVAEETRYLQCVEFAKKVHERRGSPPWPALLGDPYLDHIVDVADRRQPRRSVG